MKTVTKILVHLLTVLVCLYAGPAYAKLKVTKAVNLTAKVPASGANSNGTKLCANGLDVLVREKAGETQVLIDENQDGKFDDDPANEDNELVELEDGLTWEMINIFLGGNHCTEGHTTKFTMTGGHIGCVHPISPKAGSGEERAVSRGEIYLDISGGSLADISTRDGVFDMGGAFAETAKVTIVVNNAHYEGYKFPYLEIVSSYDSETGQYELFSNISIVMTNCTFRDAECLSYVKPEDYNGNGGGFITNADGSCYTAFGNVTIPEDVIVATDSVTVLPGAVVNNLGTVKFRSCLGVTQMEGTWNGNVIVEPTGHGRTITRRVRATCTKDGFATTTCLDCRNVVKISIQPALGHDYISEPAIAATCTTSGMTSGTYCSRCGLVSKKVMPVAPTHKWRTVDSASEMKMLDITPSTFYWCEDEATGVKVCTSCGKVEAIEPAVLSSDDHSWSSYTSDDNATCSTYPTKTRYCTHYTTINGKRVRCFATQTIVDTSGSLKDHVMLEHPAKEPTCEMEGNEFYYECTSCGKYFDESKNRIQTYIAIPANGHTFDKKGTGRVLPDRDALASSADCTTPAQYYYRCSECSVIGDEMTYSFGKPLGHSYRIYNIDYVNPEVPETGYLTLECQRCSEKWKNFAFSHHKASSLENGLSYDCNLTTTYVRPTCQTGLGEYTLNMHYGKSDMTTTYTAPIPAMTAYDEDGQIIPGKYLIHKWDENGHCEDHPDEPNVAGYIRYMTEKPMDDGSMYRFEDGASFATVKDMLVSPYGDELYASRGAEAVAFNYTLSDNGQSFWNNVYNGFTANKFDYDRAVVGGRIVTFSLPANVPTDCINGTVYKLSDYDQENRKFVFDEYTEADIEPFTPYLVQLDNDATKLINGPVGPVTVSQTIEAPYSVSVLDGTDREICSHVSSYNNFGTTSDETYSWYGYDSTDGVFVKALTGNIRPFRTALSIRNEYLNASSQAAPRIALALNGADGETNIISVDVDELDKEGSEIYDLTGKKVATPEHGHIYIINGKKQLK